MSPFQGDVRATSQSYTLANFVSAGVVSPKMHGRVADSRTAHASPASGAGDFPPDDNFFWGVYPWDRDTGAEPRFLYPDDFRGRAPLPVGRVDWRATAPGIYPAWFCR